jgi:hypothetical protein
LRIAENFSLTFMYQVLNKLPFLDKVACKQTAVNRKNGIFCPFSSLAAHGEWIMPKG